MANINIPQNMASALGQGAAVRGARDANRQSGWQAALQGIGMALQAKQAGEQNELQREALSQEAVKSGFDPTALDKLKKGEITYDQFIDQKLSTDRRFLDFDVEKMGKVKELELGYQTALLEAAKVQNVDERRQVLQMTHQETLKNLMSETGWSKEEAQGYLQEVRQLGVEAARAGVKIQGLQAEGLGSENEIRQLEIQKREATMQSEIQAAIATNDLAAVDAAARKAIAPELARLTIDGAEAELEAKRAGVDRIYADIDAQNEAVKQGWASIEATYATLQTNAAIANREGDLQAASVYATMAREMANMGGNAIEGLSTEYKNLGVEAGRLLVGYDNEEDFRTDASPEQVKAYDRIKERQEAIIESTTNIGSGIETDFEAITKILANRRAALSNPAPVKAPFTPSRR